jgi:hypothetical protein
MSTHRSTIAAALETLELTNSRVALQGELRTHNAFSRRGVFQAELFDGVTTLRLAFDSKELPIPRSDCYIEAEGTIVVDPKRASLLLWVEAYEMLGDSPLQGDIASSYEILQRTRKQRKKRSRSRKIRHVLVFGPKTDAAHATQDFLNALERHAPKNSIEVSVRQVKMRGPDAAFDIAEEIEQFNDRKGIDLCCIVSGGGDKYDLDQVFAAPVLVEAVCLSKIPCLVGVGHSKDDFPLNDAAFWYADTPSAAGAMLGDILQEQRKGCYIVSATCGADSPEVQFFYAFRDTYLAPTYLGRLVITGYYRVSPGLAKLIHKHPTLKRFSYVFVIRPLYIVLRRRHLL